MYFIIMNLGPYTIYRSFLCNHREFLMVLYVWPGGLGLVTFGITRAFSWQVKIGATLFRM